MLPNKMLQRYSVRLRIYSWFMKYCHPKLASAGVIAAFPVVTLVGANTQPSSYLPTRYLLGRTTLHDYPADRHSAGSRKVPPRIRIKARIRIPDI